MRPRRACEEPPEPDDPGLPGEERFERPAGLPDRDLGQEAEPAEVHAHDRDAGRGRGAGDAEQGAVAAQDDDKVRPRRDLLPGDPAAPAELPRRRVLEDAGDAAFLQEPDEVPEDVPDAGSVGLDDETDRADPIHRRRPP